MAASPVPISDAAPARATLLLVRDGVEHTVAIDHSPFSIGRRGKNSLVLTDPHVSREQAVIVADPEGHRIEDRGSSFGTFVNGERVERARLRPGDCIRFGGSDRVKLIFAPDAVTTDGMKEMLSRLSLAEPTGPAVELERLTLCLEIARRLSRSGALEDILATLVDATLRLTGAERGFVFLCDAASDGLRLAVGRTSDGRPLTDESTISHSIIRRALDSGSEFVVGDARESDLAAQQSIVAHELRTVICMPLLRGRGAERADDGARTAYGVLYLDSRFVSGALTRLGRDLLGAIAEQATALVENAQLAQAEEVARRYARELALSSQIQQGLMQVAIPEVPFARVRGRSIACRDIGGDFFDVIEHGGELLAVVADVSGKGISAALLASTLQGMIHALLVSGQRFEDVALSVNHYLCRKSLDKYATLVLVRVNPAGEGRYLICGHIPPVWLHEGRCGRLAEANLPVGLLPEATYEAAEFHLSAGDRLLIVTDGVTEAEDAVGGFFGDEGLERAALDCHTLDDVQATVERFRSSTPLTDDCTMLEIVFRGD